MLVIKILDVHQTHCKLIVVNIIYKSFKFCKLTIFQL